MEIQPRIRSDECAIYRNICDNSRQNEIPLWIGSTSDRMPPEIDNIDTEPNRKTDERTAPTTTTPPVPQHLKILLIKQQTSGVNDSIPAKGCRHLLVKPWAHGTRKGTTCQLRGAIIIDKTPLHPNRKVGGRTELDLVQDEINEAKRLLEEAIWKYKQPRQSGGSSMPSGEAMDEMTKIKSESGVTRSMKTGQRKRLLGGN